MLHPAEQDVGGTFHSEGNYQDLHSLVDLPCIDRNGSITAVDQSSHQKARIWNMENPIVAGLD
jgi:hypothetical protein